jgi:hypothetical protein
VRGLAVIAASTVALALVGASTAVAAPETVSRAEVRWRLGDRLDGRLARSCIRPQVTSRSGGAYTNATYAQNGPATGTVDLGARTGDAVLDRGTLRFAKTRRAARGTRSLPLGRLGVQLTGQGGYLVSTTGGRVERIASIPRMTLTSGPIVQRGVTVPSTFRLTLGGTARALAPLAALGDARCRGGRPRSGVRTGAPVGTVSLSVSPSRAVGLAGSVGLRLFLNAGRDPATGQLLAIETQAVGGARAEGESILLPVTGTSPLVRGAGDAFLPTGAVATSAGVAFAAGVARVELTNLSFVFSGAGALQGLTGSVAGVPQVIATAGAGGVLAGEPGALAAIAAGLGAPSVSIATLEATVGFTRTGAAV